MDFIGKLVEIRRSEKFLQNVKWDHWEYDFFDDYYFEHCEHFPKELKKNLGINIYFYDITEKKIGVIEHFLNNRFGASKHFEKDSFGYITFINETKMMWIVESSYWGYGVESYMSYERSICTKLINETNWKHFYKNNENSISIAYDGVEATKEKIVERAKDIKNLNNLTFKRSQETGNWILTFHSKRNIAKSGHHFWYKSAMMDLVNLYPERISQMPLK